MAGAFGCSSEAVRKALKRMRITRKKKTTWYQEQDPEKVMGYLEEIKDIPPEDIAYVDETGIDTCLYREYAYAPEGEAVYSQVPGKKYKRVGIVAAKLGSRVAAPFEYSGTMDSRLFEGWFAGQLLPALPQGAVIVMDNAAFHRKQQLSNIAERNCHRLIFLPPYSPELNPIEKYWGWLKRRLRKVLPFFKTFDDALFDCFKVD